MLTSALRLIGFAIEQISDELIIARRGAGEEQHPQRLLDDLNDLLAGLVLLLEKDFSFVFGDAGHQRPGPFLQLRLGCSCRRRPQFGGVDVELDLGVKGGPPALTPEGEGLLPEGLFWTPVRDWSRRDRRPTPYSPGHRLRARCALESGRRGGAQPGQAPADTVKANADGPAR